jgi:uncharacterized SAM-binding protein YcdF (DUF218 family)
MYFVLSKLLGGLTDPVRLALLLVAVAALLRLIRRLPRLRKGLFLAAPAVIGVFSIGAVSSSLCRLLEARHPRPQKLARPPAAIVMLTGVTDDMRVTPSYYELAEGADRLVETVRLAHEYPRALVVLSGGSSALRPRGRQREARVLARLARELGVPAARILVDERARNTRENAVESKRLLERRKVRGPVLLVTSAIHMPRALGCFERAGARVTPWPVDFQGLGYGPGAFVPRSDGLLRSRMVLHELVGLLAYWVMGYI